MRRARIVTVAIALGCATYIGLRFDFVTLPEEGCSPVSRYAPGSRLLVDRWAWSLNDGDCVFVAEEGGVVHLAILERSEVVPRWHVVGDSAECPCLFPPEETPVSEDAVLGRIVLSLGR